MANNIKSSKRANFLAHRGTMKRTMSMTVLIGKSEARLRKLEKDKAPVEEIIDEQKWLDKLLAKESE